jgi:hypothetical protein
LLNHGSHGSINDEYAFLQQAGDIAHMPWFNSTFLNPDGGCLLEVTINAWETVKKFLDVY